MYKTKIPNLAWIYNRLYNLFNKSLNFLNNCNHYRNCFLIQNYNHNRNRFDLRDDFLPLYIIEYGH